MRNKIFWVTGSNGFIGKHLVQELEKNNFKVKRFSNNKTVKDNKEVIEENKCFYMDFSSRSNIYKIIDIYGCPDIFIHLGWGDMESPMSTLHLTDNVNETEILIDTFYSAGLDKFVFIGSMNEYGARLGPLSEDKRQNNKLRKRKNSGSELWF